MREIFENEVEIEAPMELISKYLQDPSKLSEWNYAVVQLEKVDNKNYKLYREYEFGEEVENVFISERQDHLIEYQMTGGRINYIVKFELNSEGNSLTKVKETISIDEDNFIFKAISLIKPVTKKAFRENLIVLKNYFENKGELVKN